MAAAFELDDENGNAEAARVAMRPLRRLARMANCAVMLSNRIGKNNENQSRTGAYKMRGASNSPRLARSVFAIEKELDKGEDLRS